MDSLCFQSLGPSFSYGVFLPSSQAAVYAAHAAAQISGKIAFVRISAHPKDLLFAASGLYIAWADRIAVVVEIPGDLPHEFSTALKTVARTVLKAQSLPLCSEEPLEFPLVVTGKNEELDAFSKALSSWQPRIPSNSTKPLLPQPLKESQQLLRQAKKPILLAGGGAIPFLIPLLEWAERSKIPVLLTARATTIPFPVHKSLIARSFSIPVVPSGNLVGVRMLLSADLIIAVGSALSEVDGFGLKEMRPYRAKLLHIGTSLSEASAALCTLHLPLTGEEWLSLLTGEQPYVGASWEGWCEKVQRWSERWHRILEESAAQEAKKDFISPFFAAYTLTRYAPNDTIFVSEGGACGMQIWATLWLKPFVFPCQTGCIGVTLPFSLGVQAAYPRNPVWNILGDGAFFYYPELLAIMAEQRLPIVTFVFNDACYGAIRLGQTFFFGSRYIATDLPSPEFSAIAREYGCDSYRVDHPQELLELLPHLRTTSHPVVVDLRIPKDSLPIAGGNFVLAEFDGVTRTNLGSLFKSTFKAIFTGKLPLNTLRMGRKMLIP